MQSFAEYLLECKLLSEEQLLQAMIEAFEELPSINKIVADQSFLSASEHVKAIIHQRNKKCSFIEACTDLGFWKGDYDSKLRDVYSDLPTFQEMVVRNGTISPEQLNSALDEFIARFNERAEKHLDEDAAPEKAESPKAPAEAAEETPFRTFDKGLLGEFSSVFCEDSRSTIEKNFSAWQQGDLEKAGKIESQLFEMYSAAKFIRAEKLQAIVGRLISVSTGKPDAEWVDVAQVALSSAFDFAQSIISDRTEENYWKEHQEILARFMKDLPAFEKEHP